MLGGQDCNWKISTSMSQLYYLNKDMHQKNSCLVRDEITKKFHPKIKSDMHYSQFGKVKRSKQNNRKVVVF